jgi:hypothetical protein
MPFMANNISEREIYYEHRRRVGRADELIREGSSQQGLREARTCGTNREP